jgi:hypothetical protein
MMSADLLAHAATVVAASQETPGLLLLAGPGAAVAVYWRLWQYYRNTGKSHSFERETRIVTQPVTGHDSKVDKTSGTTRRWILGKNSDNHRERVQRGN